jgi:hypothetical protein
MNVIVVNGKPISPQSTTTFTFVWPPPPSTGGKIIVLTPGESYFINTRVDASKLPDPISTSFTSSVVSLTGGGSVTSESMLLNYTAAPVNQTLILGGGDNADGSNGNTQGEFSYL